MSFLWLSIFLIPSSLALSHVSSTVPSSFRNATVDDIDDITTVWMDAFKPSPIFSYIRQFADGVGEEYTWTCQRDWFLAVFQQHAVDYRFQVITVPESASPSGQKAVSFSVWDLSQTEHGRHDEWSLTSLAPFIAQASHSGADNTQHASGFNCSAHLDTNLTRAVHFQQMVEDAECRYLVKPFGPQLQLALLATHPSWDGHGFAAQHLQWGKTQLDQLGEELSSRLPITLMATPAGFPLYIDEGFKGLKNVTLERLDGKEAFWYEAMAYEQPGDEVNEL